MFNKSARIVAGVLVVLLIGSGGAIYGIKKHKRDMAEQQRLRKISISKETIRLCADIADKIGTEKIQLNWKEIAAVNAVKENNYDSKVNETQIEAIANSFVIEKKSSGNTYYGAKDMKDVAKEMTFTSEQVERANSYYNQLDEQGLYPENLKKDSPQRVFIESIKPYAVKVYEKYGILPSIVAAQAFYESEIGKSKLSKDAHNYFGIKADTSWNGKTVTMDTTEFHNQKIVDKFRAYDSIEEAFNDYGNFLTIHPRYRQAGVFEAKDFRAMAEALQDGGYSTAENAKGEKAYATNLYSVVRANDLMVLDSIVLKEKFNKKFSK